MVSNLDYKRIISYLRDFSDLHKSDVEFSSWLEEKIIKTGVFLCQNNIPLFDNNKRKKIYLILRNTMEVERLMQLKNENIFFLKNNDNGDYQFFIKFLKLFFNWHESVFYVVFLSRSDLLKRQEIILNIYNLKNVNSFARYINIYDSFSSEGIMVLNLNSDDQYINHLTFLNPLARELLNKRKYHNTVFDLVLNGDISIEEIKKTFSILKNLLIKYEI